MNELAPLLKLEKVLSTTSQSRTSLYSAMQRGDFPRPVQVGPRRVAWKAKDVAAWVQSRPIATASTPHGA